ncbi:MAG: LexA repressor [Alphaproteobacteria bacterium MarineAlpha9_Bin1]|nr:MAG: LexA repressor [Alphaproteobacteria bacterium MarineAlpha9_Bin1]
MLTKKQKELLEYVNSFINTNKMSPSYDEIREAMNLKSKSGIHRIVSALEERGFIRKLANRARAIEVLKNPDKINNNITSIDTNIEIPLCGKIAAGTPIEAISNVEKMIKVPKDIIGNSECFALEVSGDSMIEAGILDKDVAIIEKKAIANEGNIVVALIHNEEATLKIFTNNQKNIILKPANENYDIQTYNPNEVKIQGILVGLIRKY